MLLLLGALFAVDTAVVLSYVQQQENDGRVINLAGRQRMLSQKLAKEAFAIAAGNDQLRTTLEETASDFDRALTDLLEGNAERRVSAAGGKVRSQLETVSARWEPFYEQVRVVQTKPQESAEFDRALRYIGENSVPLLREIDVAVGLYENQLSNKIAVLKRAVIGLAVTSVLVAAAGWWFILAGLGRSLSKLAKGATRLGRGDLDYRVAIDTADEVGIIAREFNAMADRLKASYNALAQRAGQLEERSTSLQRVTEALRQAHTDTVLLLAAAAEAHDHTTGLHLQSVRALTESLALELGYSEEAAKELALAAALHDIGKIFVPDSVLASAGELSGEDWEVMKRHTSRGGEFLGGRPGFELAAVIARSHHERWDGSGYPDGLAGEQIPEAAAIVAVADAFDAITSDRSYRPAQSVEHAVEEIMACSGKQFSPRVAEALAHLCQRDALPLPARPAVEEKAAA